MTIRFDRFLSTDSAKAVKASGFGYLNGINYMAPSKTIDDNGRMFDLCSHASQGCIDLCLGKYSGQASMVKDLENGTNDVRLSRARKAVYFMRERQAFLNEAAYHIARLIVAAWREGLSPCVRLNGSSDIAFEGLRFNLSDLMAARINRILKPMGLSVAAGPYANIMSVYPDCQFVDYTKNPNRFKRTLPANYHLTFSLSETNAADAARLLSQGVNVAAVFAVDSFDAMPKAFLGARVINGDEHDLRHLDPKGPYGVIVGLTPKGNKAWKDKSGFIVREWSLAA